MFWRRSAPALIGLMVLGAAIGAGILLWMSLFMSDRGEGGPAMAVLMTLVGAVLGGLYALVPAALCALLLLVDVRGRHSPSFRIAMGTLGAAVGAPIPELVVFGRATLSFPGGWGYYAMYIAVGAVMAAIAAIVAAPLLAWGEQRSARGTIAAAVVGGQA